MKALNPAAIGALKEALTSIYWFKRDLRSFLRTACGDDAQALLAGLNWEQYKFHLVSDLVDTMAQQQPRYKDSLIRLMLAVCDFNDFSHLARLDDGDLKVERARAAVRSVRSQTSSYREQLEEREQAEKRRELARAEAQARSAFRAKLSELRASYLELATNSSMTPQDRGRQLEPLLRSLFELFDLDPRGSFRTVADQIDGAFSFDGGDYILGARWQKNPLGIEDLDAFKGKVTTRLENTLGLYVSISGYSRTAVERHNAAQPVLILMDGLDLMAVLDGRVNLDDLLLRKRRHAAQTGEVFLRISEIDT